jgi:hypothetical protein
MSSVRSAAVPRFLGDGQWSADDLGKLEGRKRFPEKGLLPALIPPQMSVTSALHPSILAFHRSPFDNVLLLGSSTGLGHRGQRSPVSLLRQLYTRSLGKSSVR